MRTSFVHALLGDTSMTISDLGNIGEFIGSIVLVISVLYLAVQVRLNAKAERNSAMQNILTGSADANNSVARDTELAGIMVKGFNSPDSISEIERFRFHAFLVALYHHLDGAFQMHKSGLLEDEIWSKFDYEAPLWLHIPVVNAWYETDRNRLSPSFQAYLDKRISETEAPTVFPTFSTTLPTGDA